MWPVSDRFLEALRGPHDAVAYADVYYANTLVMAGLPVEDGSVSIDEGSDVRRTARVTVADPSLAPADIIDMLSPFGTEIRLRRGIAFPDAEELVPLGVFRIDSAEQSTYDGGVDLELSDRTAYLQDARFLGPWSTPAGVRIVDEIATLVLDALPDVEIYDLTDSDDETVAAVWERDRWEAITTLATSVGAEVIFDPEGRAVIRPTPNDTSDPVWTIDAGPNGVMLDVATGLSREGVYNAVVALGEATTENTSPIVGRAVVTLGPLAYGGPFGKVPRFFTSSFLTSPTQATNAALRILVRSVGFARRVDPSSIVNPALDAGDAVLIAAPVGPAVTHIVRQLEIPLGVTGEMPVGTRVPAVEADITLEGSYD